MAQVGGAFWPGLPRSGLANIAWLLIAKVQLESRVIRKIRAGEVDEPGKRMQIAQATGLARSFYTLAKMAASTPAITTPWLDAFCVGGFSFLLVPVFFAVGPEVFFEKILFLTIAINMPHFIASYRLLYQRREMIARYRWAAIYVPCGLLAYAGVSLALVPVTVLPVYVLLVGSGVYLAWHYTGQAWGMMASFAYLAGRPFEASEQTLIRRVWSRFWSFTRSLSCASARSPGLSFASSVF